MPIAPDAAARGSCLPIAPDAAASVTCEGEGDSPGVGRLAPDSRWDTAMAKLTHVAGAAAVVRIANKSQDAVAQGPVASKPAAVVAALAAAAAIVAAAVAIVAAAVSIVAAAAVAIVAAAVDKSDILADILADWAVPARAPVGLSFVPLTSTSWYV